MKPALAASLSLVSLALLAAPSVPAEACALCSCASPDYPDPAVAVTEARDSAEAVFLGEVVEIRTPGGTLCDRADMCSDSTAGAVASTRPSYADVTVTLRIEEAWKGVEEDQRTFALTTSVAGATCGFPFEVGRAYLVYAQDYENSGVPSTNICTRTQPAEDASFDRSVLGR